MNTSENIKTPLEKVNEKIAVLMVEDNPSDAELVHRFVTLAGKNEYEIAEEQSLKQAVKQLEKKAFDLILLDLNLPDSDGRTTFDTLYEREKLRTPILVLTGLGDEELGANLVRAGAVDFLVKGRFDAFLLSKVLRYARERFALLKELNHTREMEQLARERETRERELRMLAEMSEVEGRRAKAPLPLCDTAPTYFAEVVQQYEALLEIAIQHRIYRDRLPTFGEKIRSLARELGSRRASPKDLVELHSRALQTRLQRESQVRNQAFIEEGRILLLELMGYIIEYYRAPAVTA